MSTILRLVYRGVLKYDSSMIRRFLFTCFTFLLLAQVNIVSAQIDLPPNDGFFTTNAAVISKEEAEKFEYALQDIAKTFEERIVVFFAEDIFGKDIQEVAKNIQKEWGLEEDTVLLLIAYKDRSAAIVTAADSSLLNPTITAGIVQKDINPHMRAGEYNLAVVDGVEAILFHKTGKYTVDRYADAEKIPTSLFVIILYAIVSLIALSSLFSTIIFFATDYHYSIAGTLIGPIVGVVLLEQYGLWLSIPPFLIVGVLSDVCIYKLYKSSMPKRSGKKRRRTL